MDLVGSRVELAAQDPHVAGRVERHRHPISGDSPNFQDDILPNVNPFTDLSAEHQHRKLLVPCLD
jgi:hypothetical protein